MKLLFKQRMFSWFDSYDIYDEAGRTVYTVHGQLDWGHNLQIYGVNGVNYGGVKEVVLTWLPKFELYQNGALLGTMRKKFTWFKPAYSLDFNGCQVSGNVMGWDYTIAVRESNASRFLRRNETQSCVESACRTSVYACAASPCLALHSARKNCAAP